MAVAFIYAARSAQGAPVNGSMVADTADQVLAHLRARALVVTAIDRAETPTGAWRSFVSFRPRSGHAKLAFIRAFATMIAAAIPLRNALEICIEQSVDSRLSEALRSILSDIQSGLPLSAALQRRPDEFPRLFVAMVRSGEIGGALDAVLERLAHLFERDRALKMRLKSALAYPAIVTVAAVALVLFLVGSTIPAFASMFAELHVALPPTTRALIALGNWLQSPLACGAALFGGGAAIVGGILARRNGVAGGVIDRCVTYVPLFGPLVRKVTVERFCRTLSALLHSGIALVPALEAACDVVENVAMRRSLESVAEALREGQPLTASLAACATFEPLAIQLVRAGEETGTVDTMLGRIAEYYELEVDVAFSALTSVIEPLLIVVLGIVVGTIVGSILIPLYSMIGSIR